MDSSIRYAKVSHLRELKTRVDEEQQSLRDMVKELKEEIRQLRRELDSLKTSNKNHLIILKDHAATLKNQDIVPQSNELVTSQIKSAETRIYAHIAREFNEKYVPKMNEMANYVRFNSEDPMVAVNNYRFGLNGRQMNAITSGEFNGMDRLFLK